MTAVAGSLGKQAKRNARRESPARPDVAGLAADLRRVVAGEVRFGAGDRALYAYDASVFRQLPVGVVIPRHTEDLLAALSVCRRHGVPVLARGCGTALAGQTVNTAVVFDFSKYMNAIVELDPAGRRARVQPGVICDELRDAAQQHGLTFGVDPATHDHATLGGMIGNNSCGTHSVMAGKTTDNIDELEIITYDGVRMRVGSTSEPELERIIAEGGRRGAIYAGLKHLRDTYAPDIRSGLPNIPRRVSGYNLDQLLPENGFHVARALVGTEGTCALVVEASCRLVPSPPKRSLVVLGYPDIPSSGDDVAWLMGFEPIALEFTSQHVLDNIHAKGFHFGGAARLPDGQAWLLVEFGGDTQEEADSKAEWLVTEINKHAKAPTAKLYESPTDEQAVWEIRRHSAGTSRMPIGLIPGTDGHGGWPTWEDAACPRSGSATICAITRTCSSSSTTTGCFSGTGGRAVSIAGSTTTYAPPREWPATGGSPSKPLTWWCPTEVRCPASTATGTARRTVAQDVQP
jgi:FAD/FMN-containing dehydrogenase